jgi:ABC-type multidrug transport system ATPase subunit
VIRAEGVAVHFRRGLLRGVVRALDSLDLEIREGDFFALLGQNGAGKSTAMYCMLGLLQPTLGRVSVLGQTPEPGSDMFRYISYLPEEPHYHDYLTVLEAVSYYGALYGAPVRKVLLDETLERLGMAEHRHLALRKCSKGMKQKVGIAQCLVNPQARVFFLDEPMRGLDPITVRDFRQILIERNRAGATIIINSHILSEVELVANRAAIIDHGKVVAQDELSRLARVNAAVYVIEIEEHPELPAFFNREGVVDGHVRGSVRAEKLYELLDFTRAKGIGIASLSRHKTTLEESFMRILGHGAPQ